MSTTEIHFANCTACAWAQPAPNEHRVNQWAEKHHRVTDHVVEIRSESWETGEATPEQLELYADVQAWADDRLSEASESISRLLKSGVLDEEETGRIRHARGAFNTDHGYAAHYLKEQARRQRREERRQEAE